MIDDDVLEEEFGMTQEHMNMLMVQHFGQCQVKNGVHEANVDEATGVVVWGPCQEKESDR